MQNSTKQPRKIYQQNATNYQQKKHMRFPYRIYLLLCLFLGFTALQEAWASTFVSNVATGSWNSASSWTKTKSTNSNTSPGPGDVVVIRNGHIITLNSNIPLPCDSVTIENDITNTESTVFLNGFTLAVKTIIFNTGGNNQLAKLDFGSGTLKVSDKIIRNGNKSRITFAYTTNSIIEFNGTTPQVLEVSTGLVYPNVHMNNSAGVTPDQSIDGTKIKGNIIVLGGKFDNNGKSIAGAAGKTFEVKNGATFTASGTTAFPTVFTPVLNTGSTVEYAGGNQTIAALPYSNLIISGTGTKTPSAPITLDQNMTLSSGNTLRLINGSVTLGDYNFIVQQGSSITGISTTNYIKQTGTGKLIMENIGTGGGITTEVLFPVGTTSSYTPAYITNLGPKDNFSVRVANDVRDNFNNVISNNVIMRTWNVVQETTTGTANVTLKLQWNAGDQGTPFDISKVGISHYFDNTWHQPATFIAATGTGPYTATLNGISHFSPFGVGDINSPLPVELVSFKATKKDNATFLQWVTASEKNNEGFYIQHSADGRNFEDIGFVASKNSNSASLQQYDFLDKTTTGTGMRYYRLKQTDFDGTVSFSDIKVVQFENLSNAPLVYPNPFQNELTFSIVANSNDELSYQVIDLAGKTIYQNTQKLIKGNNSLQINLDKEHPAGFYLLRTQTSSGTTSTRLIRQ